MKELAHILALIKVRRVERVKAVKTVKASKPLKPAKRQENREVVGIARSSNDYYALYREMYKRPGTAVSIKKGLFNMLYILFFPLRLANRHKLVILSLLAALYVLLAFTEYGRSFTNKYMGFDLNEFQTNAIEKAKYLSSYAVGEFNRLTGIDEWRANSQAKPDDQKMTAPSEPDRFVVTAQQGLNIRKKPDPGSEKVGAEPLPYGSSVTYLSKSQNDPSGKAWYYVQSDDGRTGWVSARFLKGKEEAGKNG